ncbi:MAG TPA: hypothetical protein VK454_00955, partial [Myxococcaceae bacterium]|nr:hypothetical protein [Myxococcaceae bacterium]
MLLRLSALALLFASLVPRVAAAQSPAPSPGPARLDPSLAADVVELDNPAFPSQPREAAPPERTPLADLLPVPAAAPLRDAAAALDAGQPAAALRLLAGMPDQPAVRYLRTLAALRQAPTAQA